MRTHWNKILIIVLAATVVAGCSQLPYERTTQTSVAGAAAGATAGAVLAGDDDQVLGAALGGVLGAAAGYVIGARTDWFGDNAHEQALNDAVGQAQTNPATVADVYNSYDADLNDDGLVTQDELIAMSNAGLSADEIIDRLQATNQVFSVNRQQRQALLDAGVSPQVVYELDEINQNQVL